MKIKGTEVGTGRPLICVPVLEKTKEADSAFIKEKTVFVYISYCKTGWSGVG